MKKGTMLSVVCLVLAMGCLRPANAQDETFTVNTTLKEYNNAPRVTAMPSSVVKKLVSSYISNVTTGDPTLANLTNYATLKIDQLKANVNVAAICTVKNDPMPRLGYSANFSGGVEDNIVSVWSGGGVSADFNLRMEGHLFIGRGFWYNSAQYRKVFDRKNLVYAEAATSHLAKIDKLEKTVDTVSPHLDSLSESIMRDEIYYQRRDDTITKVCTDSLKKYLTNNLKFSTVRLIWLTGYTSVGGQKFKLYREEFLAKPDSLLLDEFYVPVEAGVSLNFFFRSTLGKYRLGNSYMKLSFGYIRSNSRDYSKLKTYRVTYAAKDTSKTDPQSGSQQVIEDKKAYPYQSYREFEGFRLAGDIYKNISRNFSLHGFFDYQGTNDLNKQATNRWKNIIDAGFGTLFTFPKKDDPKSLVNFEPVVTFQDLTNEFKATDGTNKALKDKVNIQVRLTVPFAYFF
ncbi:MAG: hypothetical protein JNK66_03100 [Chitinophagales bacterium]|nr:hypothetical protein [Chitinophagales bacterium]